MTRTRTACCLVVLLCAASAAADRRPILHDGRFGDWKDLEPLASDPGGDGTPGGIDLGRLWVTNDLEYLYLRLEVGRETILQNGPAESAGNSLRLFLDLDGSAATGLPAAGLGAELEARFGERRLIEYDSDGRGRETAPGGGRVTALPTHSDSAFETRVELPKRLRPDPGAGRGSRVRLFLVDEIQGGDRLPDTGSLAYRLDVDPPEPPGPIALERSAEDNLRILSLNVGDSGIVRMPDRYRRLLRALAPDVIGFQEIREWDAEETRQYVVAVLPGRDWRAEAVQDVVTVSAYPILAAAAVDGNLAVRIDLPDRRTGHDLVLFNAHLPCCNDDEGRDRESDNLAAAWRDMLAGDGLFSTDRADAVVMLGDFNFVGFRRQLSSIRRGDFIDSSLGPDFRPGRGKGRLATASARRTHAQTVTTWRRRDSQFAPGRLDWVFFSSDVLTLVKSFSLDTAETPTNFRREHRLKHGDSRRMSDHLPVVVDFEVKR